MKNASSSRELPDSLPGEEQSNKPDLIFSDLGQAKKGNRCCASNYCNVRPASQRHRGQQNRKRARAGAARLLTKEEGEHESHEKLAQ